MTTVVEILGELSISRQALRAEHVNSARGKVGGGCVDGVTQTQTNVFVKLFILLTDGCANVSNRGKAEENESTR